MWKAKKSRTFRMTAADRLASAGTSNSRDCAGAKASLPANARVANRVSQAAANARRASATVLKEKRTSASRKSRPCGLKLAAQAAAARTSAKQAERLSTVRSGI